MRAPVGPTDGLKAKDPQRVCHVVPLDLVTGVDVAGPFQGRDPPSGPRAVLSDLVDQQHGVVVAYLTAALEAARGLEDDGNRWHAERAEESEGGAGYSMLPSQGI